MKTYREVKHIERKSVGMVNSLDIDNSRHSSRIYRAGGVQIGSHQHIHVVYDCDDKVM